MAQINLGGSIGVPGSVAVLGNTTIAMTTSDHIMTPSEFSNKFIELTGSIGTNRNLIAPLNQGQEFTIWNNTTGGFSVTVKGSTGTGITIPNDGYYAITCDGFNYLQTASGSGSPTGAAGGDLSSNYPNPTVSNIHGSSVPAGGSLTTGNTLSVTGSSALGYSSLNLGGGSGYITGNLPISNVAPGTSAQILMSNATPATTWTTISGDVSIGATGSTTVTGINGHAVNFGPYPITASSPTNGQILEFSSSGGGSWNAVTISGSGVSWTGDLGLGFGATGSSDSVQYVTSISGSQGGASPGRIQLYGNNFHVLNSVTSTFLFDWMPMTSSVGIGTNGHTIQVTGQTGQVGGPSFNSGSGGNILLTSGLGGSGGGSNPGGHGYVQISTPDSSSIALLSPTQASLEGSVQTILSMIDNSASVTLLENQLTTQVGNSVTLGTTLIQNTCDGYNSFLQMNGGYPFAGDTLVWLNAQCDPAKVTQIEFSVNLNPLLTLTSPGVYNSGVALPGLLGSGTGFVGINNDGLLSWQPYSTFEVTWADDLSGNGTTTDTNQYVSSLSYSSSAAGGPIAIKGTGTSLAFDADNVEPLINQTALTSTSSGSGAAGEAITLQAQAGQASTFVGGNGGTGGILNLYSGIGGTPGSGGTGGSYGSVTIGDPIANNITVISATGTINLTSATNINLSTTDATISMVSGSGITLNDGYGVYQTVGASTVNFSPTGLSIQTGVLFEETLISSASYTVDSGSTMDYYLMCDPASTAIGISLPTAFSGRTLVIKDYTGHATTNNITVTPISSIDGASPYIISTNYGSVTLAGVTYISGETTHHIWAVIGKV